MRVLHVATELFPLLKVGGLADVLGSLPVEQAGQGIHARVLLPGHPSVLDGIAGSEIECEGWNGEGRILLGTSSSGIPVYVLDAPEWFGNRENSYVEDGEGPGRFGLLAAAALRLAQEGDGLGWTPDLLHCHDWPAGLVPAYLHFLAERPVPAVMTIHNAAYQGLYPETAFPSLGLPAEAFQPDGMEFHGQVSFLKAGLQYANKLTTVSSTYAAELQHPGTGMGLEGIFLERSRDFVGILNGVDQGIWNPAVDPDLLVEYDRRKVEGRAVNKAALQEELGLSPDVGAPLFSVVSRLDDLKGLDLLLQNLGLLQAMGAQLVVLGRGDPELERGFSRAAAASPGGVAWVPRHDESLAHRIFGSADFLVMPSRSEPCGLTQMYALRYGVVPVVRRTGGLADTVVDEGGGAIPAEGANGITFEEAAPEALAQALMRAWELFWERPEILRALQQQGMRQDLGWAIPAARYRAVYQSLFNEPRRRFHGPLETLGRT